MPAIWSSSERPISVREVWVDGIRHAILSPDDPFHDVKNHQRHQTYSSKSKNFPVKYMCHNEILNHSTANLDNCLVKFHVLANQKSIESLVVTKITRRQSAPPISQQLNESRNLLDILPLTEQSEISRNNYDSIDDEKFQSSHNTKSKELPSLSRENSFLKSNVAEHYKMTNNIIKTVVQFSDHHDENFKEPEINKNPLSERVLYWMDMSGRVKDYKYKEEEQKIVMGDRRSISDRSKACNIHRRNSTTPSRDSNSTCYKMCQNQTKNQTISHELNQEKIESEYVPEKCVKIIPEIQQEIVAKSEIILERNKSVWSSFGRPQLHIFMPDLNSSVEKDISFQHSPIIEDSCE